MKKVEEQKSEMEKIPNSTNNKCYNEEWQKALVEWKERLEMLHIWNDVAGNDRR